MNLFFPQWQGAGRLELLKGAQLLRDALSNELRFTEIPVARTYSLALENNIFGYNQILSQLMAARTAIQNQDPNHIWTLGGDCGVELAPISFLNQKYGRSLGVIWLDAHADLNTPDSSPSGHFHGMPLRVLLGSGDSALVAQTFSRLRPEQVFLVGSREFDLPEADFIQAQRLTTVSAQTINTEKFEQLHAELRHRGCEKIYIHLDLDVTDPKEFPHVACPTSNGIAIEQLAKLLSSLKDSFEIVGFSVLEFLPIAPTDLAVSTITRLLEAMVTVSEPA